MKFNKFALDQRHGDEKNEAMVTVSLLTIYHHTFQCKRRHISGTCFNQDSSNLILQLH